MKMRYVIFLCFVCLYARSGADEGVMDDLRANLTVVETLNPFRIRSIARAIPAVNYNGTYTAMMYIVAPLSSLMMFCFIVLLFWLCCCAPVVLTRAYDPYFIV
ncbi:hypothetical protein AbHV_ORF53 [Abalone herpesvirus Victoria/AUS/2009]|uniref:Uncharacterized protein n=1 Tax=Abalone herpesvirus (isolate Abalone/Australia/Victoria/2009) TaxID=1241371 RepID=K4JYH2_ABHV|nr:hypothetical protein AbHV_ORF53 [Abalone herpesvirus Victoria/AUS/2009]AFU90063.1 hypothetical protein AbHV_ORF53 [Abalone herpesvirus Victoria/AUS/2009]UCX57041.1 ORF50 [Haliotid herpesvirus 1]